MHVYISGPVTSNPMCPDRETNKHAFRHAEHFINQMFPLATVVNPLDVPPTCGAQECGEYDGHSWNCWLRGDLIAMLKCDTILMLPGWIYSEGAKLELNVARGLSFDEYHLIDGKLVSMI